MANDCYPDQKSGWFRPVVQDISLFVFNQRCVVLSSVVRLQSGYSYTWAGGVDAVALRPDVSHGCDIDYHEQEFWSFFYWIGRDIFKRG